MNPNKSKYIKFLSYSTSLQGLSLYVFTSLINWAFSCQSFNSAPLWIPRPTPITLLRSGNESFIKVGAKNHQKKHQNHPERDIGQYYVPNWRKRKENIFFSHYELPIISTIFLHCVLLNRKQITLQAESHLSSCRCYELLYAALFTVQGGITREKYHQRRR